MMLQGHILEGETLSLYTYIILFFLIYVKIVKVKLGKWIRKRNDTMVKLKDIIEEEEKYGKRHIKIDMTSHEMCNKLTLEQLRTLMNLGFAGDEYKKIRTALAMKKMEEKDL